MDWIQESLDIMARYEKLKSKALQTAGGNLDETSETPLTLEEKIAKKWYRFEPMEQFEYRDSLVEFVDRLSSSSSSSTASSSSSTSSTPSSLPGPLTLPSSISSNLRSNLNSATSTVNTPCLTSSPISKFICKKWEPNIYTHKNILRRTWEALERTGEAKEWVRGIGEGEDPEKEWVELMERVIKRGLEMEGGTKVDYIAW
jgi:hypothetical protein